MLTIPAQDEGRASDAPQYSQAQVEATLSRYPFIGQLERGEKSTDTNTDGYLHWQVWIENATAIHKGTIKNLFDTAHIEPRIGSKAQALAYVSKIETFAGIRIGNGKIDTTDKTGERRDLQHFYDLIRVQGYSADDVLLMEPMAMKYHSALKAVQQARDRNLARSAPQRHMKVSYLYGATGTGKTRYLYEKYGASAYRATDYEAPFDAYQGEGVIILDEFRSQLTRATMLNILDGYPTQLHGRYLNKWSAATEIWVVSNWRLESQYENSRSEDRNALFRRFYETNAVRQGHIYQMKEGGTLIDETDDWKRQHDEQQREFAQFEQAMNYEEIGK
jgi:hypothetical protein